ncbi:hypothetical protein DPMN_032283 [Dreissena polymorpha]|uniref:Uncharacterized protein n=1 Tax=Dreissena polymorpha TaxID=45954 RepID=A0A9D4M2K5_DREPO|nr:hypothetical protein DPMN_032283 [Dreissena polymorpha]
MASSTPTRPFTATLSSSGQDDTKSPMRRKNSMGNMQELDAKNISVNFGQHSKSLNLTDLIQATRTAPGFAEVVGPSLTLPASLKYYNRQSKNCLKPDNRNLSTPTGQTMVVSFTRKP